MKTRSLIFAVLLLIAAAVARADEVEFYNALFVPNSLLPPDAVEVYPVQDGIVRFYQERPKTRPTNIPASYILVRVFGYAGPERMVFLGWFWLDGELVKRLHRDEVTI